jgi:ceramide glucosyltransferase
VALALLAVASTGFGSIPCALLGITVVVRSAAAWLIAQILGLPAEKLWLLPLRDGLSFAVFIASFFGRRVVWRDQNLEVAPNGRMTVAD